MGKRIEDKTQGQKFKLLSGDCLERLKELPDNSVDMVLADLPYGTTACKWDTVIPFEPLWAELNRVCKPNAAMCMFGSEPFSSALRMSNIKRFRYDWIWRKNTPSNFLSVNHRPMTIYEICSVFSNERHAYFPQGLVEINKTVTVPDNRKNAMFIAKGKPRLARVQRFTNYPRNILEFPKDGKLHTSQKPVALLEYLIKTYTNEGETVLDPTMGSGSTGVACLNTGRRFIGIEREPEYLEIAKARIQNKEASLGK